jgi:tripartite-type tricarboxylate transporter receptor subunit TctC
MKPSFSMIRAFIWTAVALSGTAGAVHAQSFPSKPVRMIVPFSAGSGTDVAARAVSQYLTTTFGQSFIVDNKPGASGSIGAMEVIRAAPDGYTLLFGSSSTMAANVALVKNMPYDPTKDFTPIAGVADSVSALLVKTDFPAKTMPEFIAYAKQHPGKLNAGYGSSSTQVSIAQVAKLAGLNVVMVPYKSTPLAVKDLLGGTIDFTFADLGNATPHTKSGSLRALGIGNGKRSPMVPDWPAIAESTPGFEDIVGWIAIAGPPGMPKDVSEKLGSAVAQALQQADVRTKLATFGLSPMPMSPEQLKAFIDKEVLKWVRLAKEANIQPE